jgi:hypothetical protein
MPLSQRSRGSARERRLDFRYDGQRDLFRTIRPEVEPGRRMEPAQLFL